MIEKKFLKDIDDEVVGVDEVGRGSLAGPVVSCAVLLDKKIKNNVLHKEINDSKKISEKKRLILSDFIKQNSIFSIGIASNIEIDRLNILNATILSMKRALKKLCISTNIIKIDGSETFNFNEQTFFVKKGDQKSVSIAAASIVAKCYRDKLIRKLALTHPLYQWEKNKGYGTKKHISAIKKFGLSHLHRKSFLSKILD
tara:strand:- start:1840 stop:2436 length:597 start_codon:yes stop_codon:yes gene_type:complete